MTFSLDTALEMAKWSQAAYKSAVPTPYTVTPIHNYQTDIHALFVQLCDRNILSFRGTDSIKDWLTDAEIEQVNHGEKMKLHKGFFKAYLSVDSKVLNAIETHDRKPLWIIGHSLGGALASIAAFMLAFYSDQADQEHGIAGVYTFGCPRWTNHAGARAYDRLLGNVTWRVNHALDPVPCIPWAAPGWRSEPYWHTYQHVGLWDDGTYEVNRPFLKTLPHKIKCVVQEEMCGEGIPIKDHKIDRYIAALEHLKATALA